MTNSEKYLKDEVSAREFREKLAQSIFGELGLYEGTEGAIDKVIGDFLDMIEKPTLTEDERVILRNIDKKYTRIGRSSKEDKLIYLYVNIEDGWKPHVMEEFGHLFQFIKERRRILYWGTVERRIKMNIIELLKKIYNGEIKDDTIFYGGDLFYKLIVVDKKLYIVNTRTLDLEPVESDLIVSFVVNNYKIYEYKMVLD